MLFSRTCRPVLSLALSLLWPAMAFAQTPARPPVAQAAGYRWRTLALRHAVPSGILALMHWNGPATPEAPALFDLLPLTGFPVPSPATLPDGVRRIFALQSNNSLLVEATEEGYARVAKIVRILDIPPRQVQFRMELVAVPEASGGIYSPDAPASQLFTRLLAGGARVTSLPTETVTDGTTVAFPVEDLVVAPGGRFRLAQIGPRPGGYGMSTRRVFRLAPRLNADGTITLGLAFMGQSVPATRTLRAGEMVVYDVTRLSQTDGQRLFLFLQPTIIGESDDSEAAMPNGGSSVTVTP